MLNKGSKIIITGAAGFIGSCMAAFLEKEGYENLLLVDDFSKESKSANTESFAENIKIDRDEYLRNIAEHKVDLLIHLGARTDTTEMDYSIHKRLNLEYSKAVWSFCRNRQIPLIYASSAATYGGGEHGYSDNHNLINQLQPLNPYGESKHQFDQFVLSQEKTPPRWYGLKFFNVFGPNEYHKGRMASVIFHAFNQIKETGGMKLFRSHNSDFKDGEQMRDFVYVKDVINVIYWLMNNEAEKGIYNLGSGKARTFLDLVRAVFRSLDKKEDIKFVDTPEDIRDKYQYFTEADMSKLRQQGFSNPFYSLEDGIIDYVKNYLTDSKIYQ